MMLASFYHDFLDLFYCYGRALGVDVSVLQIWAWEHIFVLQSIVHMVDMELDDPIIWRCQGENTLKNIGHIGLPYW